MKLPEREKAYSEHLPKQPVASEDQQHQRRDVLPALPDEPCSGGTQENCGEDRANRPREDAAWGTPSGCDLPHHSENPVTVAQCHDQPRRCEDEGKPKPAAPEAQSDRKNQKIH